MDTYHMCQVNPLCLVPLHMAFGQSLYWTLLRVANSCCPRLFGQAMLPTYCRVCNLRWAKVMRPSLLELSTLTEHGLLLAPASNPLGAVSPLAMCSRGWWQARPLCRTPRRQPTSTAYGLWLCTWYVVPCGGTAVLSTQYYSFFKFNLSKSLSPVIVAATCSSMLRSSNQIVRYCCITGVDMLCTMVPDAGAMLLATGNNYIFIIWFNWGSLSNLHTWSLGLTCAYPGPLCGFSIFSRIRGPSPRVL